MLITLIERAIGGKTIYPMPPDTKVNNPLIIKVFGPKMGGISCEYMAAKVANRNAQIRRKTSLNRTK